ncbi:MAG: DUF433 domain-containing protein [Crenarchaeota archaeon]|nr:DUF433 domain-containing protein [Thermoproteota archaeon]
MYPSRSFSRDSSSKAFSFRARTLSGSLVEDLLKRIAVDPRVMGGKPVIKGTRITVDLILELLASGMTPEEIAEDYGISVEDVKAALLYASKLLKEEEVLEATAR